MLCLPGCPLLNLGSLVFSITWPTLRGRGQGSAHRSLPQRAKGVETTPTPLSLGQGLCSEAGVPCGSDLAFTPTCWVSATSSALYPAHSPCRVASCSAFILPSLWPPANPSSTSTLTPSCSHLCSPAATRALCLLPQTFSAKEAALEILRE